MRAGKLPEGTEDGSGWHCSGRQCKKGANRRSGGPRLQRNKKKRRGHERFGTLGEMVQTKTKERGLGREKRRTGAARRVHMSNNKFETVAEETA